ncbi:MAG: dockerin type I domain-containing protein, partial [Pirellulales bacterium]
PHLVAPSNRTSFAAPLVAGTAAMLIDFAKTNTAISNGTASSSFGRNNWSLRRGETSEVIRAVLMAGADRQAITNFGTHTYAVNTANGLNDRYGAGQLDVYQSYHILAGGEQDPREAGNLADISLYGWDYEAAFSANTTKTYRFTIDHAQRTFAASLIWNVDIDLTLTSGQYQDLSVDLRNLNLQLRNTTTGADVLTSNGTVDSSENLYIPALGPGTYELVVSATGFVPPAPFVVDYGLAWRFAPTTAPTPGDVDLDGAVSLLDLGAMARNFGKTSRAVWTDGDLDANGRIDGKDFRILSQNYGSGAAPAIAAAGSPQAIPEPSAGILLACGGLLLLSGRLRSRLTTGRTKRTK